MKTITIRQMATIKRVAQNVNPLVVRKNKVAEQITKLNEEFNLLVAEIEGHEMGVKALTGYLSEDIVVKTVEDTGKVDKNGNPIKTTKYVPRENVVFNEEENVYYIHEESPIETSSAEETSPTYVEEPLPEVEVSENNPSFLDNIINNI